MNQGEWAYNNVLQWTRLPLRSFLASLQASPCTQRWASPPWRDSLKLKRKKLLLLCCIAGCTLIHGCTVQRSVNIAAPIPQAAVKSISVSSLEVTAPTAGQNVFTFADTVSNEFGTSKRAEFEYKLQQDSGPQFRSAFSTLFQVDEQSDKNLSIQADFKYYIAEKGLVSNIVAIEMNVIATLSRDFEPIESQIIKTTIKDSYSTFPITFPRNSTLEALFQAALSQCVLKAEANFN